MKEIRSLGGGAQDLASAVLPLITALAVNAKKTCRRGGRQLWRLVMVVMQFIYRLGVVHDEGFSMLDFRYGINGDM